MLSDLVYDDLGLNEDQHILLSAIPNVPSNHLMIIPTPIAMGIFGIRITLDEDELEDEFKKQFQ